jgi:basic amino acid/polyamine antiporter, APA family
MEDQLEFKPSLGLLDAAMIVAGSMIGSGIFIVSADITRNVGSAGWLIMAWVFAGFLTISAALSYGELSSMYPKAGGQYTYLKEAFSPLMGFLYGWTLFAVIQTGTIAAVGVAFTKFAAYFFPALDLNESNVILSLESLKIQVAHLTSVCLIVLLTYINTRGVEGGKKIQTVFTITKLTSLLGLIILGFALGAQQEIWNINWANAWQMQKFDGVNFNPITTSVLGLMAAAMVGSVFSADAWNNITFIAGEVKNPKTNIGLSLLLGTSIVIGLYIITNLMYTAVLTLPEIATAPSDRVAIVVCQKILGNMGTKLMAALIMTSTFGCINGLILSGARVYYTMAKDKMFFKSVGELNNNAVPAKALWMQCIWASLLCLSGKYGDLLDYVVIAVLIFYIITIIGLFKLRIEQPNLPRPYKAFAYPILPALYIIVAATLCVLLLIYKPDFTLPGVGIVALGLPIYFIFIHKNL